jgi:AraC-like DNA-binding protein
MLLPISILTIILSFLLVYHNWGKNRNVLYLGISFFSLAFYGVAHDLLVNIRHPFYLALILNHITPVYLLAGPMLYFYIRGNLSDENRLTRKDSVHFIPAIFQLISILPWIFKPWSEKIHIANILIQDISQYHSIDFNMVFPTAYNFLFRPLHLLMYVIWSAVLLWRFRPERSLEFRIPDRLLLINHRWMRVLLTSLFLTCFFYFVLAVQLLTGNAYAILGSTNEVQLLTGIFFFLSAGLLLFFPDVLYGLPRVKNIEQPQADVESLPNKTEIPVLNAESAQLKELSNRILAYMEHNRPYTRYEFSINDLAEALDVPLNQVSWCLNRVMDIKFTTFRMKYRVAFAKQLLEDGKTREMTIEAVGNIAGFSSRSSFYTAFKEIAGMTPTEYLEKVNAASTQKQAI